MAGFRREERGSALVVVLITMSMMLSIGLATIAFGGGQRRLAYGERLREATFNLSEATLNAQLFVLSQNWPGTASTALPASCTSTTTTARCPDRTTINSQFTGLEYSGYIWTTKVQDNGGGSPDYYSSTVAATQPSYDANQDGTIWVRGQATIRGVTRAIVTQVKAQLQSIPFPRNVATAGHFATTNNGKKVIVDTNGASYGTPTQPGKLSVRCSTGPPSSCLNYDPSKGQVSPPVYETNYSSGTVLTPEQLNSLREKAKALGTYTATGCPSSLAGETVFIENGNCSYNGGSNNSLSSPGVLVVATGTLSLSGNASYNGLIYMANLQNSTGDVVSIGGCAKVVGSVLIEGQGGISAASCGVNLAFDPNVVTLVKGYGNPAPVKSTWREVRP
jgi:hypothetical protein